MHTHAMYVTLQIRSSHKSSQTTSHPRRLHTTQERAGIFTHRFFGCDNKRNPKGDKNQHCLPKCVTSDIYYLHFSPRHFLTCSEDQYTVKPRRPTTHKQTTLPVLDKGHKQQTKSRLYTKMTKALTASVVPTKPFPGQKPGTSGLRKKVAEFLEQVRTLVCFC